MKLVLESIKRFPVAVAHGLMSRGSVRVKVDGRISIVTQKMIRPLLYSPQRTSDVNDMFNWLCRLIGRRSRHFPAEHGQHENDPRWITRFIRAVHGNATDENQWARERLISVVVEDEAARVTCQALRIAIRSIAVCRVVQSSETPHDRLMRLFRSLQSASPPVTAASRRSRAAVSFIDIHYFWACLTSYLSNRDRH